MKNEIVLYWMLIGLAVTYLCIYIFRKDGTSPYKGELYFAALGPFIWPILLVKLIWDLVSEKIKKLKK